MSSDSVQLSSKGNRPPRTILVCQNQACRKSGSKAVLAAFQAHRTSDIPVIGSGCLGRCGNGPMVLILPNEIWYSRVRAEEAIEIMNRWAINS
ncbi:(2Fe-2S) ferredoxin domain-containing protein [Leptolyngbya ohadii]|uniref:(2Fe-2S) ferredoxin domain-containing protein n=1 Tax=Leptolyngbya ohadii TaxID=1962290 RepID=UPI000B59B5C1|nr:(2Fe-2S) ferredoxin domain-containing protein [Leptolyngbya ohadii]